MSGRAEPVTIRLWAGARAAAGVSSIEIEIDEARSVGWLAAEVVRRAPAGEASAPPDRERLARVLEVCSVLVGEQPLGAADRDTVMVAPGSTLEFLPPFAGG